ncbi:fec operon regulator FecR [compost metagenome]
MRDEEIIALLEKHKTDELSPDEKILLESWYIKQARDSKYDITNRDLDINLQQISKVLPLKQRHTYNIKLSKFSAAAIILVAGLGFYFAKKQRIIEPATAIRNNYPITAGKNSATLSLAGGKSITLSDTKTGVIIGKDLRYNDSTAIILATSSLNTSTGRNSGSLSNVEMAKVSTPRGGTYQVVLPDGTRVWLNAASSLSFPTKFDGHTRIVSLKGEAYFEVAHNKSMPFRVKSIRQEIEVLGTHFNINSYSDEIAVKTTLLEGSVRIITASQAHKIILKPGQQALVEDNIKVADVNIESATAWKNGEFMFRNESLESIMRAISRWYNVEIVYQTDPSKKAVWGTITKYSKVSEVLEMITLTGAASFKIEGNKIIVMNKK